MVVPSPLPPAHTQASRHSQQVPADNPTLKPTPIHTLLMDQAQAQAQARAQAQQAQQATQAQAQAQAQAQQLQQVQQVQQAQAQAQGRLQGPTLAREKSRVVRPEAPEHIQQLVHAPSPSHSPLPVTRPKSVQAGERLEPVSGTKAVQHQNVVLEEIKSGAKTDFTD